MYQARPQAPLGSPVDSVIPPRLAVAGITIFGLGRSWTVLIGLRGVFTTKLSCSARDRIANTAPGFDRDINSSSSLLTSVTILSLRRTLPWGRTTSNSTPCCSSPVSDEPRVESNESRLIISSFAPFHKFPKPNVDVPRIDKLENDDGGVPPL